MRSLTEEALGGFSAGVIGTVIGYPLDVIKTHMQTSSGATTSTSFWRIGSSLVRTQGIFALYRGVLSPLLSLGLVNTLNFGSYSYFQALVGGHRGTWDWRNGAAGACCGPLASTISTVETLIKTQMQLHSYPSTFECIKQLVHRRGVSVLYTGHAVGTGRAISFLLTYFLVYEGLRTDLRHLATLVAKDGGADEAAHRNPPWWVIPSAGGLAGAAASAVSFPFDTVRTVIQGRDLLQTTGRSSAPQVVRQLVTTKGLLMGLFAGLSPCVTRAFLVSATRFSAYETTLWLLRGGRDLDGTI
jgi:solute carrier family 25 (mitochondrial carnitine/acylcarnitine transporter), member 20/29